MANYRQTDTLTLNPSVPHPGLFPTVMSWNGVVCHAFSAQMSGLRKPSGGLPLAMRASFSRATIPVNAGVAHEVPSTSPVCVSTTIVKLTPSAATSGMACAYHQRDAL